VLTAAITSGDSNGSPLSAARVASRYTIPVFKLRRQPGYETPIRLSEYLGPFKDVSIFIFHGKKDLNVSFEETEKLIGKLRQAGANVEVQFDEDRGHEPPGEETISAYLRWLDEVLRE
jgi:predicted esterase